MASSGGRTIKRSSGGANESANSRIRQINSSLTSINARSGRRNSAHEESHLIGLLDELGRLSTGGVTKQELSSILQTLCLFSRNKDVEVKISVAHAFDNLARGDEHVLDHDVVTKSLRSLLQMGSTGADAIVDILWAMGSVVYGNGSKCTSVYSDFFGGNGFLTKFLKLDNPDLEIRRAAANCVGCFCAKPPGERRKERSTHLSTFLPDILRVLVVNLRAPLTDDKSNSLKNICTVFKAIYNVVLFQQAVENAIFPELLATIKAYMFFELGSMQDRRSETSTYDPLARLLPAGGFSQRRQSAPKTARAKEATDGSSDSESASDFWTDSQPAAPRAMNGFKVRHSAMMCAQAVIQCGTKTTIFRYWQSFVPDNRSLTEGSQNIVRAMLIDPLPKGRISALGVLLELLQGSKQFLAGASENRRETAFTSHSAILGAMLRELHYGVEKFLSIEKVSKAQTQALKVACVLASNSPYERLASGHILSLVNVADPLLKCRDYDVRVAVLTFYGKLLSIPLHNEDEYNLLGKVGIYSDENSSRATVPSLVTTLIEFASDITQPVVVKVEAIQALCSLFETHPAIGIGSLKDMVGLAKSAAADKEGNIRLHAAKMFGSISKALADYSSDQRVELGTTFWVELLGNLMPTLLKDELPIVRSSACDCMSLIGECTFSALPVKVQYLCQSLLLGMTGDAVTSVRAAASRAVGVLVLYEGPRDDDLFVMDVANALLGSASDQNVTTRIRASWALGNLCDTFVLKMETNMNYAVPGSLLSRLVGVTLTASKDNDKVRPNAMRALGGLGRSLDTNYLNTEEGSRAIQAISEALCKNLVAGPVKVRWNAAYALGNLFKNENLVVGANAWGVQTIQKLHDVISTAANFKVRINAAAALAIPSTRRSFGSPQVMAQTVETLIAALETIEDMEDFSEYKYQKTLQTQLSTTLKHILELVECVQPSEDCDVLLNIFEKVPTRGEFVCDELALVGDLPQVLSSLGMHPSIISASSPTMLEHHGPDSIPDAPSPNSRIAT